METEVYRANNEHGLSVVAARAATDCILLHDLLVVDGITNINIRVERCACDRWIEVEEVRRLRWFE